MKKTKSEDDNEKQIDDSITERIDGTLVDGCIRLKRERTGARASGLARERRDQAHLPTRARRARFSFDRQRPR